MVYDKRYNIILVVDSIISMTELLTKEREDLMAILGILCSYSV